MQRILECVPNFSEGRDPRVIQDIVTAMEKVEQVKVLHTDMGYDANRTVITLAGEPEAVVEAAFRGISRAAQLIDMRVQTGAHPRMGATDVCPLIPVKGVTMEEVVALSEQLARKVGEQLHIPVYLYEKSQPKTYRQQLQDIRHGEYEGWREKIKDPMWQPDHGPAVFNEKSGCTVIGARPFLVAYNINLAAKDVSAAQQIARQIRGSGYKNVPGLFPTLKAIGWYMPQFGCAQVSTNITDMDATPLHMVYEAVKKMAGESGVKVTGSELVGMIPEAAILEAGKYYGENSDTKEQRVQAAISGLGLDSVKPFDPYQNILEWKLMTTLTV